MEVQTDHFITLLSALVIIFIAIVAGFGWMLHWIKDLDKKFDKKIGDLDIKFDGKFDSLSEKMASEFKDTRQCLHQLDSRLSRLEGFIEGDKYYSIKEANEKKVANG